MFLKEESTGDILARPPHQRPKEFNAEVLPPLLQHISLEPKLWLRDVVLLHKIALSERDGERKHLFRADEFPKEKKTLLQRF